MLPYTAVQQAKHNSQEKFPVLVMERSQRLQQLPVEKTFMGILVKKTVAQQTAFWQKYTETVLKYHFGPYSILYKLTVFHIT